MSKKIKSISALVMAVLMVFTAYGTVAVSAAGNNSHTSADFAVYFENCKNWERVWAYTWYENDITDANGKVIGKEVIEVMPFPGVELSKVGKTTLIDKVEYPNATEHEIYEYKCEEVYDQVIEDKVYDRAFVIFNQGFEHGQQSSATHIGKFFSDIHLVGLDKDNNAIVAHYVSPEYICLFDDKKSL
ncbi:MAG: hypothetical protein IJF19_01965 [Clostridia bacterium]|nr:hypothetical protein [Clostridia bacterium]